jgi:hypothetical protein
MILKGNAAALLLWLLLTAIMVLMTGWMHFLGNREPSQQDAQQITRTLQYQTRQLQDLLHWVAALPSATLRDTVTPVDLRLIVDRADVRLFHLTPAWETERPALLGHLVNYLNQPRAMTYGVMYWRDKVLLVAVHEDRDETRLAGLFLDEWLARLVEDTGLRAKLISNDNIAQLRAEGHALVSLPAMHGQPVYIDAVPVLLSEAIPFRWWVVIPVSVLLSALLVWFFYYRPVWRRVFALQKQVRDIMQSSSFRDRVQVNGRDEIGGLATLFNSLLSSLEYSYN